MAETDVCWCGQKQTHKNVDGIDWTDCGICRAISDADLVESTLSHTSEEEGGNGSDSVLPMRTEDTSL